MSIAATKSPAAEKAEQRFDEIKNGIECDGKTPEWRKARQIVGGLDAIFREFCQTPGIVTHDLINVNSEDQQDRNLAKVFHAKYKKLLPTQQAIITDENLAVFDINPEAGHLKHFHDALWYFLAKNKTFNKALDNHNLEDHKGISSVRLFASALEHLADQLRDSTKEKGADASYEIDNFVQWTHDKVEKILDDHPNKNAVNQHHVSHAAQYHNFEPSSNLSTEEHATLIRAGTHPQIKAKEEEFNFLFLNKPEAQASKSSENITNSGAKNLIEQGMQLIKKGESLIISSNPEESAEGRMLMKEGNNMIATGEQAFEKLAQATLSQ